MKISILIADDSPRKVEKIVTAIYDILTPSDSSIEHSATIHETISKLKQTQYDLLVLDLNLPARNGDSPKPEGGIRILQELSRRKDIRLPHHILGLTEFDDLIEDSSAQFTNELWHLVKFSTNSRAWADQLGRKLIHIIDSKAQGGQEFRTDLAVITALQRIELESVLKLDANWHPQIERDDSTIYHAGKLSRASKSLSIVAATANEMGMAPTAALAMKMIERFRPRYIAMTGICAGIKGGFGDIVVAETTWDYGSGKNRLTEESVSIFHPAPSQIPLDPSLRAKFSHFLMDQAVPRQIQSRWSGAHAQTRLSASLGPVASGAAVLENTDIIGEIASHNRKLLAVEMETYGVFVAARLAREPRPLAISIKSICDFGDTKKDDAHQEYAAFTSAQFLAEFALTHL